MCRLESCGVGFLDLTFTLWGPMSEVVFGNTDKRSTKDLEIRQMIHHETREADLLA